MAQKISTSPPAWRNRAAWRQPETLRQRAQFRAPSRQCPVLCEGACTGAAIRTAGPLQARDQSRLTASFYTLFVPVSCRITSAQSEVLPDGMPGCARHYLCYNGTVKSRKRTQKPGTAPMSMHDESKVQTSTKQEHHQTTKGCAAKLTTYHNLEVVDVSIGFLLTSGTLDCPKVPHVVPVG